MNQKSEVRNPRAERYPNPEARSQGIKGLACEHFSSRCSEVRIGLRISDFFRDSGIRLSDFRMNRRLIYFLIFLLSCPAILSAANSSVDFTASFEAANKLYEQGKFSEAASAYKKLLSPDAVSPAVCFNLGNAFFRSGEIGRAIAAYRQAQALSPRDADLRASLQFARNQVQGPTLQPGRWERWLEVFSVNGWTLLAAAAFWATLLLLALFQFRPALKQSLRHLATTAGVLAVVSICCAGSILHFRFSTSTAIVVAREAAAHNGPLDESPNAFAAHDGAELKVLDAKDDWLQVSDGTHRIGWLRRSDALVVSGNALPAF